VGERKIPGVSFYACVRKFLGLIALRSFHFMSAHTTVIHHIHIRGKAFNTNLLCEHFCIIFSFRLVVSHIAHNGTA
jgi:hypothetical protein